MDRSDRWIVVAFTAEPWPTTERAQSSTVVF
jgi:hypothetical protein